MLEAAGKNRVRFLRDRFVPGKVSEQDALTDRIRDACDGYMERLAGPSESSSLGGPSREAITELASADSGALRSLLNALSLLAWPKVFGVDRIPDWDRLSSELRAAAKLPEWGMVSRPPDLESLAGAVDFARPREGADEKVEASAVAAVLSSTLDALARFERGGVDLQEWADSWAEDDIANFIRRWARGFMDGRANDLKFIKSNVKQFADPHVALHFRHEDLQSAGRRQAKYRKALAKVVKELDRSASGGQRTLSAPVTERLEKLQKELKGRRMTPKQTVMLEEFARYKRLRRWLTEAYREVVMDLVLRNGGMPVDMRKVQTRFKALKVDDHPWPKEFIGKLGIVRRPGAKSLSVEYYTTHGELLALKPIGKVRMNPAYVKGSSKAYCSYIPPNSQTGAEVYVQTVAGAAAKQEEKFEKVDALTEVLEQVDIKGLPWRKGLTNDRNPKQDICACIEFIYQTCCRVGSEDKARTGSFGASTLQRRHVRRRGSGGAPQYQVRFFQKRRNHIYELEAGGDRHVKALMRVMAENARLRKGQSKEDAQGNRLFLAPNGRGVSNRDVNNELKAMGLPTAHKFRHARGTRIMRREIEAARRMLGPKPVREDVESAFWKAAEKVAVELHHVIKQGEDGEAPNAATSVRSYIAPAVTRAFFAEYGLSLPRKIQSLLRTEE